MLTKLQLAFVLLLCSATGHLLAQSRTAVWYFGRNLSLSFTPGKSVEFTDGKLSTLEGSASICDENGELLFYTDGVTVWNRSHRVMDNGTGLKGHWSSTQSALIVPRPGNPQSYYLFTADEGGYIDPPNDGVHYSEVNMCLDNGLGGVVASTKNTLLHTPATEKLAAVHHRNGTDFWVVTHEWNSNAFRAYLVTKDGVSSRPVISRIGFIHGPPLGEYEGADPATCVGQMKISPDGKHLAVAVLKANKAELFDFDNQTGRVSNLVQLNPADRPYSDRYNYYLQPYGVEFSGDGSKLYVNTKPATYQYNVLLPSAKAIQESEFRWLRDNWDTDWSISGGMQLGPDGEMYVAAWHLDPDLDAYSPHADVIKQPSLPGLGCDYQYKYLKMKGNRQFLCFPGYVASFFFSGPVINHQGNRQGEPVLFSISSKKDVVAVAWDFDDPASNDNDSRSLTPRHAFTEARDYQVRAEMHFKDGTTQTLVRKIIIHRSLDLALGPDTTLCPGQSLVLRADVPGSTCLWSDGTAGNALRVSKPGTYWVEVCTGSGSKRDSIRVSYFPELKVELGPDQIVCGDKPVVLKATVAGSSYRWNTGSTDSVLTVTRSGHYVVNIANSCGSTSDSVYVTFEPLPEIELGRDTTLCVGQILRLSAQHPLGQSYRWQNGYDAAALEVTEPGLYRVEVAGKTCGFSDSIRVAFVECEDQLIIPNVFTPNGDGYNERFEVRGIRPGNWALQVSNRYGKLVFESRAYYNEWRGEDLPAGVYYYYLKDPASLRSYRGWVQLLR